MALGEEMVRTWSVGVVVVVIPELPAVTAVPAVPVSALKLY